jgi:HK97 family phage prohead protease
MNNENRYYIEDKHLRASTSEDGKMIIEGVALLYNNESHIVYEDGKRFTEIIERGALANTDFNTAYLTYNHSRDNVFATVRAKTLQTTLGEDGLYFRATLNNTQGAKDLYAQTVAGDVTGNSFNMYLDDNDYSYHRANDGSLVRKITNVTAIREISLIGGLLTPVYPNTTVWVRGLEEVYPKEKPLEEPKEDLKLKIQRQNYIFLKERDI